MNEPTASILILTYNRCKLASELIPRIVDSVGHVDHEVLVWDNGSDDGSYDWLVEYSKVAGDRVRIFGSDKNYGMEAINFLAKEARGKYMIKVDDDVIAPPGFAWHLVNAYEELNEPRIMFLGYDMLWGKTTFATRSGMRLYTHPHGKQKRLKDGAVALINYFPDRWLVNGICRLSVRDEFLKIGGHPEGVIYGVDTAVNRIAAQKGFWNAYYKGRKLVEHCGTMDSPAYRALKNRCLRGVPSKLPQARTRR
jgi:GT2 family glycosyltransferase